LKWGATILIKHALRRRPLLARANSGTAIVLRLPRKAVFFIGGVAYSMPHNARSYLRDEHVTENHGVGGSIPPRGTI